MKAGAAKETKDCPRCDGKGHIPEFGFIAAGVCFKCSGSGRVNVTKPGKYAPVNAMHCATGTEAGAFRLAEIERRFPGVLATLAPETVKKLSWGGPIRKLLGK